MTAPFPPAPSTSSVSAAELAEIRESITTLHRTDADGFCNWCGDTYPCAMAVVMHALDAAERALNASRAETAALRAERDALQGECAIRAGLMEQYERWLNRYAPAGWHMWPVNADLVKDAAPTPGADGGAR